MLLLFLFVCFGNAVTIKETEHETYHPANMHTVYIQYNTMYMSAYPLNVEHDTVSLYDIKFYVCLFHQSSRNDGASCRKICRHVDYLVGADVSVPYSCRSHSSFRL